MEIFLYLILGAFAGFLAGLLGVGGGLVIVPVLAIIFTSLGFNQQVIMHVAVGTSLASIIFTSISSIKAHHKRGAVRWNAVFKLAPGIVTGAWIGAAIADFLPSSQLKLIFGLFELYVAIQMSLNIKPSPHRVLPGTAGMFGAGNVIGTVSATVGIGGGTLTVPFLTWCNVTIREAVATSAACGLPIALAGASGFLVAGWNENDLPAHSLGYIHLPSMLGIVSASVLFAPLGSHVAHTISGMMLKRVFAVLLFILAGYMLFF